MHHMDVSPSRQRGLTMFGFLLTAVVLVMAAMLAMKVVPAYIEYFSVKKILNAMAQDSGFNSKSNAEIRSDFERRAGVDYVSGVKGSDLIIKRERGVPVVSAEYAFRTKLMGHASLVIDFKASTSPHVTQAVE